jgi:hypothetical protein
MPGLYSFRQSCIRVFEVRLAPVRVEAWERECFLTIQNLLKPVAQRATPKEVYPIPSDCCLNIRLKSNKRKIIPRNFVESAKICIIAIQL